MLKYLVIASSIIMITGCSTISKKDEQMSNTYYEAGTASLIQGDYTDALEKLLKAAELNPKNPYAHNNLALTYQVKRIFKKAEFHFKRALELKKDFPDAQNNLGALYIRMKRYDEAIKECTAAAKNPLYKTPEKAYANIGRAYYKKKEFREAARYQRRAVTKNSDFCYAHTSLGQAQMRLKSYGAATQSLKKAIQICKSYEAPYYVLGVNYVRARKNRLALKQFNVLLKNFPQGKYQAKVKEIIKILEKK